MYSQDHVPRRSVLSMTTRNIVTVVSSELDFENIIKVDGAEVYSLKDASRSVFDSTWTSVLFSWRND